MARLIILSMVLLISAFCVFSATAQEISTLDGIQGRYLKYGLIPLTEQPLSSEDNYTLWVDAYKSIVKMDVELEKSREWLDEKKRPILFENRQKKYGCNDLIKKFNLGQFGNRYYSIFSGTHHDGTSSWRCYRWFTANPKNNKDIGPHRKYEGSMHFSIRGSTLKGEYVTENNITGDFNGTLSDTKITFTIRFAGGGAENEKSGTIEIRSPIYLFGTWNDEPASLSGARGEWEFIRQQFD
ncbi:MAG: hypothetical protein AB2L14_22035 [Candidatus Xenobiia bacterium LiM19]